MLGFGLEYCAAACGIIQEKLALHSLVEVVNKQQGTENVTVMVSS